jgi:hypothetical protein
MEEGGRWLGLLSQLDRVESDRRRKEERFWRDPQQVNLRQTLGLFVDKQQQMLGQALMLEEQATEQLLHATDPAIEQQSRQALSDLLQARQSHFTAVLSFLEPPLNSALLLIHGMEPYLSTWAEHYRQLLDTLRAEPRAVYLYRRHQRERPPLADLICDIDHQEPDECYQLYAKEHAVLGLPSGLGFRVKRPCIVKFLQQESGIVSHAIEGEKDARLLVELFFHEIDAYHPPEEVYRKRFYDKKKGLRRIREPQLLEMLDSHGAVARTLMWQEYVQQRVAQGESAILTALDPEELG